MEIRDIVYEYRISTGDRMAWHSRYHAHGEGEYELHYFLEGAGSFLNHRARYPIQPETLFLTGPHEFHSIIPDPQNVQKQPISYYAVLFTLEKGEDLGTLLNSMIGRDSNSIQLNSKYHFLFETMLQFGRSPSIHQKKAAEYQLLSFLYAVYGKEIDSLPPPGSGLHHVQKAIEVMRRGLKKKLTVEAVAQKVGISKEHLIRLFQRHLHISPLQYALHLRVEAASGEVIGTERSIREIAERFGFENQFHFSRVFKKCTGLSPSAYRKNYVQYVDLLPPNTVDRSL